LQLQIEFPDAKVFHGTEPTNGNRNKLYPGDSAFHNWYRFVLSFPPHLVRRYIKKFDVDKSKVILDPFCGTGTTIVESKLNKILAVGVEANPFAHFASSIKIDWNINAKNLESAARAIAAKTIGKLKSEGIDDNSLFTGNVEDLNLSTIDKQAQKLLISHSISHLPLHKTIVLLNILKQHQDQPYFRHALLALANALVFKISNLKFGPEVGVGKSKPDCPVVQSWLGEIRKIAKDIDSVKDNSYPNCVAKFGDARQISQILDHESIDAVITSPPYPNEKDYTRTTRLESVILGFINNLEELRKFKKSLIRSNTRGIYKNDDDDKWIANNEKILKLAETIERKRIDLAKSSGFEKLYSKVTLQYFGGMAKHFADLRHVLRPGAFLAYVVGDQASYFKVMIRTGELLSDIAQSLGYELVDIDLFRTRFATATSSELREEVVILRWPG
jgi:hypothetical protein